MSPNTTTAIDAATLQAYLETHYRVRGGMPFTMRIGERCEALAVLHASAGVRCSAFITAWNPYSQPDPDAAANAAANAVRQQALAQGLMRTGLRYIDGIGQHPSNGWAGEESLLVLGLAREAAEALGRHYGQNAIVWSGADAVPQLVLLR
ncbi:hypothetical protein BKK81_02525 [Cupriavidus sp. USMAHM13]|uniref:DUF3293 domain-containing protein n=1 Tax=Cupriavidus malaysiensis TaxID=367825 RepID=A0ABN4TIR5_9BURK|nr:MULTISPECIES: DUF3293 domain-containing protein [Cupriavidus]AOY98289.1 hypothetical protein BKK81_02525 [Cupriavidus sp. USMAHM13]AOZ04720.1 hypothetical protein BKK80_01870 [Cupriavidus malaysiensis]